MAEWTRVKWTEAAQVARLLKWNDEPQEALALPPRDYFQSLVKDGRLKDAIAFLAQALPRYEAVTWAARYVRDAERQPEPKSPEAEAIKTALLWVQDPVEHRRRAAFAAARAAEPASAEATTGLAVFYSGGSVAPDKCEALPPPPHAAGLFAAAAVRIAAGRSRDRSSALRAALESGETYAEDGRAPLAR
jgi:hypothetical protein